ncbi:hypothetical protein B0G69_6775 [Paraburkholderia sp. RAU2J]|nr:hypothetical protein B0G69_6775 [Paraburkholderia sp. RAU2J]
MDDAGCHYRNSIVNTTWLLNDISVMSEHHLKSDEWARFNVQGALQDSENKAR